LPYTPCPHHGSFSCPSHARRPVPALLTLSALVLGPPDPSPAGTPFSKASLFTLSYLWRTSASLPPFIFSCDNFYTRDLSPAIPSSPVLLSRSRFFILRGFACHPLPPFKREWPPDLGPVLGKQCEGIRGAGWISRRTPFPPFQTRDTFPRVHFFRRVW